MSQRSVAATCVSAFPPPPSLTRSKGHHRRRHVNSNAISVFNLPAILLRVDAATLWRRSRNEAVAAAINR
uniref:Secreted protein n=1 Tax=Steinernema glaseri TaxID=37863 RepID=A0A1I8AVY0_9BILA